MSNFFSGKNDQTNSEDSNTAKKLREAQMKNYRKESQQNKFANSRFRTAVMNSDAQQKMDFSLYHLENHNLSQILLQKIPEWSHLPPQNDQLYDFLSSIRSTDILEQHKGIIGLRRILSQKTCLPIQEVLDHPSLATILSLTKKTEEPHLQLEAAWCLANLASGSTEETSSLIKKGVIDIFIKLSKSSMTQIAEQAIWGLGNISGDCVELRTQVLKSEATTVLLELINSTESEKIKNLIIWVFSNICRMKPDRESITLPLRKMTTKMIQFFTSTNSEEVKNDAILGMSKCAKSACISEFAKDDFLSQLKIYYDSLIENQNDNVTRIVAIHNILGGLTSSTFEHTFMVVKNGFLSSLCLSLESPIDERIREICWIISNIAIGEVDQIKMLLNEPGLFQKIVKISESKSNDISKEALWILCNLTLTRDESILKHLIDNLGILNIFKNNLSLETDSKKIGLVLEALRELFEFFETRKAEGQLNPLTIVTKENGISSDLERLQIHKSDSVYLKALNLLEKNYPLETCY